MRLAFLQASAAVIEALFEMSTPRDWVCD